MNPALIIVVVIAVIALEFFLRSRDGRVQRSKPKYQTQALQSTQDDEDDDQLQDFPYQVQNHFLSPAELSFFQNLRGVVGNRAVVSAKVGLGDVFWIKLEDKSKFRAYRNKIDRKHVDFLLCDPATMQPLLGIELDDSSHQREDRRERDAFVDQVFAVAKLPLLHVPAKRAYVVAEIAAQLAPYLGSSSTFAPEIAPLAAQPIMAAALSKIASEPVVTVKPAVQPPRCPKCGSEMVLRTVKNGANAGSHFWGCSNYPNCRGMLPYALEKT